jgi:hypothetical protein
MNCPLCHSRHSTAFAHAHGRHYFRCHRCELTFLDPAQRLSPAEEKAYYGLHQNHPDDPGYRRFLDRLAAPLCAHLQGPGEGLDFGCGPGPALARMLEERGHRMWCYDPLYAPDASLLNRQYDFVTCTEVVEHFYQPDQDMATLFGLVKSGGWLGIMTGLLNDNIDVNRWHYIRDPTHVCLYRVKTFQWLCQLHGAELIENSTQRVLIRKKAPA